jgi:hypothetical protein
VEIIWQNFASMFFGNTIDLTLKGYRQKENFVWQYLVVRYIKPWFPHLLFDLLFIPAKMTGYISTWEVALRRKIIAKRTKSSHFTLTNAFRKK